MNNRVIEDCARALDAHGEHERAAALRAEAVDRAPVAQPPENLGSQCIDGGACHHECKDRCFRRECCEPLSGYTGPWKYPVAQPAPAVADDASLLSVWRWCMDSAADFQSGNARELAKGKAFMAVADHIRTRHFGGKRPKAMLAASAPKEGKPT